MPRKCMRKHRCVFICCHFHWCRLQYFSEYIWMIVIKFLYVTLFCTDKQKLDVPAAGSHRIRNLAGRDGKRIFSTHRSHVDVVLSSVLCIMWLINA
jgi:hypothetical protein